MSTRNPSIVSVSPSNYQQQVPVNTSIRAEFTIDLDARYINDFVFMTDSSGERIDARVAYRAKVITITPFKPLSMGTTYQLTFVGDSDSSDAEKTGIRSIIGDSMKGQTVIRFSTEHDTRLDPPGILSPVNGSLLGETPVQFTWDPVEGATGYHLEVARTNTFSKLVFPIVEEQQLITATEITPDLEWADGLYYYRIRSSHEGDVAVGDWSRIHQFNVQTGTEGTIAEGDAPPIEEPFGYDEDLSIELEVVENYPQDLGNHVPTNVKSIYFRVIGDIDLTLLDGDSLKLVGQHISGDFEEESHGEVPGRTTIVENGDGTVYIIFTPEPLPIETVGEI